LHSITKPHATALKAPFSTYVHLLDLAHVEITILSNHVQASKQPCRLCYSISCGKVNDYTFAARSNLLFPGRFKVSSQLIIMSSYPYARCMYSLLYLNRSKLSVSWCTRSCSDQKLSIRKILHRKRGK
jgi:hypothetical protein